MENQLKNAMSVYNAVNDITDRDKAEHNYKMLWANRFKQSIDEDRARAFNVCLRTAIRDVSLWLAVVATFLLALIISVQWVG